MNKYWNYAHWLWQTPERALDIAYNAVLNIKALEDKYFNGQKIILPYKYGKNVASYLQSELNKCLRIAQTRLTEFKFSSFVLNLSVIHSSYSREALNTFQIEQENQNYSGQTAEVKVVARRTIDKLKLIDETLAKYKKPKLKSRADARSFLKKKEFDNKALVKLEQEVISEKTGVPSEEPNKLMPRKKLQLKSPFEKSGPFPSSIGRTFNKFKRDLMPNAESEVVEEFRTSRYRTVTSIRYLLLLILVPLLINQLSKGFIIEPLLNSFWFNKPSEIFLNSFQEERALTELKNFEEKVRFDFLIGKSSESSLEAREKKLKDKANELAHRYSIETVNAVKNIFADILSVAAFIALLVIGKRQVVVFKSFANELFYGLSDSAKAFLIILFTDMFVGFHSSHGWEVVLEGTFTHFGLPENKNFIFVFIATFPVILDSIFKYWIFRYLNQISPSAVATYRNMNE